MTLVQLQIEDLTALHGGNWAVRQPGELVPKRFQQPPPPVGESHVVAAAGAQ